MRWWCSAIVEKWTWVPRPYAGVFLLCAALVAGLSLAWFLHAGSLRAERVMRVAEVQPREAERRIEADRALVNQVLGEGEVAARVQGAHGLQAQESVFAGL